MTFAFSALLIIMLCFPGFVIRNAFFSGEHGKRTLSVSATDKILISLPLSFLLNILGYLFVEKLHPFGWETNVSLLLALVQGDGLLSKYVASNHLSADISDSFFPFLVYVCGINVVAVLLGISFRVFIRFFNLDLVNITLPIFYGKVNIPLNLTFLQTNNIWYYRLAAANFPKHEKELQRMEESIRKALQEELEKENLGIDIKEYVKQYQVKLKRIPDVYVDCLLESQKGSYIVQGKLVSFYTRPDEGLEIIELENPHRRVFEPDKAMTSPQHLFPISGDNFIIPFKEVRNINISYQYSSAG